MGGEIFLQEFKFEAKLSLEFVCAQLIPSKKYQRVHIKVAILISYLMTGVHIKYGEMLQRKHEERK